MTEGGAVVWAFDSADTIIAATVAALSAVDMSLRTGGGNSELAYVQTVRSYFVYDSTSTLTADAITVLTATGGGRWLRELTIPSLAWAYQADWYLNPSTGNDENSGATSLLPIKTLAELDRRLSSQMLQQTTNVRLMGSYAAQYLRFTELRIAENPTNSGGNGPFRLIVQGDSSAWTTIFTSNVAGIASFQNVQRITAGNRYAVTDNNLGVTDPATFVGHRIRLTTGANAGAISWVLKKLSATQFATGPFMAAISLTAGDLSVPTIITPAPGDQYVIEDVVALKGIEIVNGVARSDLRDGTGTTSSFSPIVAHVDIGQGATTIADAADCNIMIAGTVHGQAAIPRPMFAYSKAAIGFAAGFGAGRTLAACFAFTTSFTIIAGRMDGTCFITQGVGVGGQIGAFLSCPIGTVTTLGSDCTTQGASLAQQGPSGLVIADTGLGVYDSIGSPFTISTGQFVDCSGIIYGTNPAAAAGSAAIRCQSGAFLRYSAGNKPVITGNSPGTNDIQLTQGSFSDGWASVPLAIPDIGAVIVADTMNIGHVYQTGVGAAIGATNLFPGVPDKGLYTVDVYVAVTTAGAGGDQVTVTFAWTDDTQAETLSPINAASVAARGQFQARIVIETDGVNTPTWALSFPVKVGTPQVSIRIAARPMQNAIA